MTSWRYPWPKLPVGLPVEGYTVKFPDFDLGQPYQAEYAVDQLPAIGREVWIHLHVDDPKHSDEEKHLLQATFAFEVRDSQGQTLIQAQRSLGEFTWCSPPDISESPRTSYGLYLLGESFFSVRKGERYAIRVRYQPDPALQGHQGCVYLSCGGSI